MSWAMMLDLRLLLKLKYSSKVVQFSMQACFSVEHFSLLLSWILDLIKYNILCSLVSVNV